MAVITPGQAWDEEMQGAEALREVGGQAPPLWFVGLLIKCESK